MSIDTQKLASWLREAPGLTTHILAVKSLLDPEHVLPDYIIEGEMHEQRIRYWMQGNDVECFDITTLLGQSGLPDYDMPIFSGPQRIQYTLDSANAIAKRDTEHPDFVTLFLNNQNNGADSETDAPKMRVE